MSDNTSKLAKRNEQEQKWRTMGRRSIAEMPELDMENPEHCKQEKAVAASQNNGCCIGPAFLQQFVAIGAEQARQQSAILQCEPNNKVFVPKQPAPAMPVHVPGEQLGREQSVAVGEGEDWEEEQRRRGNQRQTVNDKNSNKARSWSPRKDGLP